MAALTYHLLDVFTDQPFGGNQLAVFPEATIPAELMQIIARELNLSESVFVLPPENPEHHARLRIFTPAMELPMAGHPTIGAVFVLHREGLLPDVTPIYLEETAGIIPVTITAGTDDASPLITMQQPVPQFGPVFEDRERIASVLSLSEADLLEGYPVQSLSSGVPFVYVPVHDLDALRRIRVRLDLWEQFLKDSSAPHLFAFTPQTQNSAATVRARMFAPAMGIPEDPATGAASGPLGAYLLRYGLAASDTPIISEQGVEMGRPSRITIRHDPDSGLTEVGGTSVYMGTGRILIGDSM